MDPIWMVHTGWGQTCHEIIICHRDALDCGNQGTPNLAIYAIFHSTAGGTSVVRTKYPLNPQTQYGWYIYPREKYPGTMWQETTQCAPGLRGHCLPGPLIPTGAPYFQCLGLRHDLENFPFPVILVPFFFATTTLPVMPSFFMSMPSSFRWHLMADK